MLLPSDVLRFLPLGLAQNPTSGRRLIEDYEIVYGPSLAALVSAHEQTAMPVAPSLAAIINPSGDLFLRDPEDNASSFKSSGKFEFIFRS